MRSILRSALPALALLATGCGPGGGAGAPDARPIDPVPDARSSWPDGAEMPECARALTHAVVWDRAGGALAGAAAVDALREGTVVPVGALDGPWARVTAPSASGWVYLEGLGPADCGAAPIEPAQRPGARRVVLVIFEPLEPGTNRPLHEARGWIDPEILTLQIMGFWETASRGELVYRAVETHRFAEFPRLGDGFQYDWATWTSVMDGVTPMHRPEGVDYPAIFARTSFCDRVNAGTADELWLMGFPYAGIAAAAQVGPGAFINNGPSFAGSCAELAPVMGFSYERRLPEAAENFAARAAVTMSQVFGGQQQDRLAHAWDRFSLVAAESPSFGFSGCGTAVSPPNAEAAHDFDNPATAQSMCLDFEDYPELAADPETVLAPIDCTAWGCTAVGYFHWWFSKFPTSDAIRDARSCDWLGYVIDPDLARSCGSFTSMASCDAVTHCLWLCGACYRLTVSSTDACSVCGSNVTLPDCNAEGGCAWYSCPPGLVQCWPSGTPPATACDES